MVIDLSDLNFICDSGQNAVEQNLLANTCITDRHSIIHLTDNNNRTENGDSVSRHHQGLILFTERNRILVGPVKKFPAFYRIRIFITAFTKARHLSLFG